MVPWQKPWRVHYHLPLQAESLVDSHSVSTTRGDMISALHHILKRDLCRHFEVETYTWSVLPESERPQGSEALANCLAKEIEFVLQLLPQDVEAKP